MYPFFRLILRRSMILGFVIMASYALIILVLDGAYRRGVGLEGEAARAHLCALGAILLPILFGYLSGQVVHEVRHCWFSWTLPRIKAGLLRGLLVTALATAALTTVLYQILGGNAPPAPVFAGAVFWFVLGSSIESASLSLQFHRRSLLAFLIFLAAIPLIDRITHLYNDRPFALTLALAGLAAFFLFLDFRRGSDRPKLFNPSLSLFSSMNPRAKESFKIALQNRNAPSSRSWTPSLATGGLITWIRAGEYENYGARRGGWVLRVILMMLLVVLVAGAIGFEDGFEAGGTPAHGFRFTYYALFAEPVPSAEEGENTPPHFGIYWTIGVVGWMFGFGLPLFLRSRNTPLSRRQRARVAYWSGVFQLAATALVMGVLFALLGAVSLKLSGETGSLARPTFLRAVFAALVVMPGAQWLALRYKGGCDLPRLRGLGWTVWIGGTIGAAAVTSFWGLKAHTILPNPGVEILVVVAALLVSQWIWRRSVNHFYLHGDLA